ncbi:hypothetical protein [Kitasatospora cheerisanensis]|uniref:Uncharacterized protein n=1 Tax=Kitasatospora cheerisanensis KCTC 2395 TaxID=1348663 RepID=A0A066Z6R4_9ACTN|nr:hypothetical protein [Kitasatospora cheerisanensis]KDN87934.1 hypothetical protein KCH_03470 [Kitasatospora cheerisanensis KCTC 2395]
MSEMNGRLDDKARRDEDDVRAADPEEGITSYQTMHAWEESQAEGDRVAEPLQQEEQR